MPVLTLQRLIISMRMVRQLRLVTVPKRPPLRRRSARHAYKVAVSSTKSMTGHLLGAAGGVEAVILGLTLVNGIIPPTINLDNQDPECDLGLCAEYAA